MAQTFVSNLMDVKGYQMYKNELRSNTEGNYTHKYTPKYDKAEMHMQLSIG